MPRNPRRAALVIASALTLAACSESAQGPATEETSDATAPQETEFTGDIGAATQEAVADTNAAAREAEAAVPAPAPAPVTEPAARPK